MWGAKLVPISVGKSWLVAATAGKVAHCIWQARSMGLMGPWSTLRRCCAASSSTRISFLFPPTMESCGWYHPLARPCDRPEAAQRVNLSNTWCMLSFCTMESAYNVVLGPSASSEFRMSNHLQFWHDFLTWTANMQCGALVLNFSGRCFWFSGNWYDWQLMH